jgi:hypothetical protein
MPCEYFEACKRFAMSRFQYPEHDVISCRGMTLNLLRLVAVASLAISSSLHAQLPPSNSAAFKTSLESFQKQFASWQAALSNVKVEELPINYGEGKVIDQTKDVTLQNLQLASKLAARILRSPSLDDEINWLLTISELSHGMQDLATLLLNTSLTDDKSVKKVGVWSQSLTDLSTGPINAVYVDSYKYVTSRASDIEAKNCASAK